MKLKRGSIASLLGSVLLLGMSLLLWRCEKRELLENTQELSENHSEKFTRVSINDLLVSDELFTEVSKKYLGAKIHTQSIASKDTSDDLFITSDFVNVIEKDTYKSYTIRIKRKGYDFDTENLVIEEKNGIRKSFIVSYNFDTDWLLNYNKGIFTEPKGKVYYSEYLISNGKFKEPSLTSSKGNCSYITIKITSPCPCKGHYVRCGCYQQPATFTSGQLVCGGGRENDLGGPLPTDSGGGGSFGGGSGGPSPSPTNPDNSSQTQTNLESMAEFIEFKLNKLVTRLKLNTNQTKWVSKNTEKALQVYDFVAKERWLPQAQEFAKLAIDDGEVDFEDRIINKLTNEDKCIYNKLKKLDLYKKTIKKFENSKTYNLIIEKGNCPNTNEACTDPSDITNGNITIIMEISSGNQPLNYAASLLHEGIHAEIFKYVDEYKNGIDPNNMQNLLYYYFLYKKQYENQAYGNSQAQHQHMADNFVKPIAEAIRKLDSNKYPLDYYMGFGWDGLRRYGYDGYFDNGVWTSLDKNTSTEYYKKQKIVNDNTKLNDNECK